MRPARTGRLQDVNVRPDARCESNVRPRGGGGDWNLRLQSKFLPACRFHACRQCRGDFPGVPVCPEKHGEHDDGSANPCFCRAAEKFCRNIQTPVPAGTPPRSLRRSSWRHKDARTVFVLLWAVVMRPVSLGPFPTMENGPAAPGD